MTRFITIIVLSVCVLLSGCSAPKPVAHKTHFATAADVAANQKSSVAMTSNLMPIPQAIVQVATNRGPTYTMLSVATNGFYRVVISSNNFTHAIIGPVYDPLTTSGHTQAVDVPAVSDVDFLLIKKGHLWLAIATNSPSRFVPYRDCTYGLSLRLTNNVQRYFALVVK